MAINIQDQIKAAASTAKQQARARAEAEARAAKARQEIERLQAEAEAAGREAGEASTAEEKARREAIDAERRIPPAPVSAKAARGQAERLLAAFDPPVPADDDDHAEPADVWDVTDGVRSRLLTVEIAEDARPIVLAIEGVIAACDLWEDARQQGRRLTEASPASNSIVRRMVRELRSVLAGETPASGTPEGIGRLLGEGVAASQVATMAGCVRPDGSADVPLLGAIIDAGLSVAGFDEVAPWTHLRHHGAVSVADAWHARQATVEERRNRLPRSTDHRPGRRADRRGCSSQDTTAPSDPWALDEAQKRVHAAAMQRDHAERFGAFAASRPKHPLGTASPDDIFVDADPEG